MSAPFIPAPGAPQPASAITKASDVRTRRVTYCWKGRWPNEYITIQAGEEKIGKSLLFAMCAADLTRGRLEGIHYGTPTSVLIVAVEDVLANMWVPRLIAAKADLELVSFLNVPDQWNVRDGIGLIDTALDQSGAQLVFIDAVMEHFPESRGGAENVNSTTFIRSCLRPLAALLERRRIAGVISGHPPKRRATQFSDFYSASAAFTQVSRSCLLFGFHPEDTDLPEEQRRRVLIRPRANVGRDPGALEFRIDTETVRLDDGHDDETPYAANVRPCHVTLRDLLNADRPKAPDKGPREPGKQEQLRDIIRDYLADGDWHPALTPRLEADGWAAGSIQYARDKIADTDKRSGQMGAGWYWRLQRTRSLHSVEPLSLPEQEPALSVSRSIEPLSLPPQNPLNKEDSTLNRVQPTEPNTRSKTQRLNPQHTQRPPDKTAGTNELTDLDADAELARLKAKYGDLEAGPR